MLLLGKKIFWKISRNKIAIADDVSKLLIKFDNNSTFQEIHSKFASFISNWYSLKLTSIDLIRIRLETNDSADFDSDKLDKDFIVQLNEFDENFDIKPYGSSNCYFCYDVLVMYNL